MGERGVEFGTAGVCEAGCEVVGVFFAVVKECSVIVVLLILI
jgi:hypothetical protein